jgi:hypothetical protein
LSTACSETPANSATSRRLNVNEATLPLPVDFTEAPRPARVLVAVERLRKLRDQSRVMLVEVGVEESEAELEAAVPDQPTKCLHVRQHIAEVGSGKGTARGGDVELH